MKKFKVGCSIEFNMEYEIEADTRLEAQDKAYDKLDEINHNIDNYYHITKNINWTDKVKT